MKITGARSLVLWILAGGFLVGLVLFLYGFFFHGGDWAIQPYNKHLTGGGQLGYAGQVLDRNGEVLAYSQDGERYYNDDSDIRRACLHSVGDTNGFISTGVQTQFRTELSGYNPITGLFSPNGEVPGNNVKLTLDSSLQKLALQKFGDRRGAAMVYNYKTGEILCMVSMPTFDPSNPPSDLDTNPQYEGVYLNRVLSSSYAPGSIFKIVTAAAALESISGLDTREFQCNGSITVGDNEITCLSKHGTITMKDGLAKSCNIVFAELAMELGPEKMTAMAEKMGFGESFDIDGIPTAKSQYNVSNATQNELGWSGIGQYTDTTNPCHMAILMGAIANGGTPVMPYFVDSISGSFGIPLYRGHPSWGKELVDETLAGKLEALLRYDVTSDYGDDMFPGMEVCAKTGTAEVGGGKQPNGWIVGYSSKETTPYAFAVVVEEGNYGISSAGKIASALMASLAE